MRSVQVHDRDAEAALAGQRAGVNLRGVDKAEVERGQWLVGVGRDRRRDARLRRLDQAAAGRASPAQRRPGAPAPRHRSAPGAPRRCSVRESLARRSARRRRGCASMRAVALEAHDRFILRSLSPVATMGGGVVLDAMARRWPSREAHGAYLAALHAGDVGRAALELAAARGDAGLAAADLLGAGVRAARSGPAPGGRRAARRPRVAAPAPVPTAGERRWFVRRRLDARCVDVLLAALADVAPADGPSGRSCPPPSSPPLCRVCPGGGRRPCWTAWSTRREAAAGEGGYAAAAAVRRRSLAGPGGAGGGGPRAAGGAPVWRRPRWPRWPRSSVASRAELERVLDVLARRGELVRAEKDLWFAAGAVAGVRDSCLPLWPPTARSRWPASATWPARGAATRRRCWSCSTARE